MIVTYDIENYKKNEESGEWEPVLDATGRYFTLGVVYKENGTHKVFYDKNEMWEYLLDLGKKENKRGKRLTCYAHNARYDFYQIANLKDRNLRWFSESPFICGYYYKNYKFFKSKQAFDNWKRNSSNNRLNYSIVKEEHNEIVISHNKEGIKFLDTLSLFRMSLKKLGEIINYHKEELPIEIGKEMTPKIKDEIAKYCLRDCKVIMEGIRFLKEKLKDDGVHIRNLCTINQIAISYILSRLREGEYPHVMVPRSSGEGYSEFVWRTKFRDEIHSAYRGGYVRVWKTGFLKNVSTIDYNSLYPASAMKIDFPNLKSERKVLKPLELYTREELFSKIGISRCIVVNKSDKLGLLPIRTNSKSYVPLMGKYIIGTWTHIELLEAVKSGDYVVLDVQWSVLWDKSENPFKDIFPNIYNKRLCSPFDKYFYKQILNGSIGKFGQTRVNQEMVIDSIEKINDYLMNNYEVLKGLEGKTDIMYVNKNVDFGKMKKYYAPIIPCLITAMARVTMYRCFKKIPLGCLCYTDTDSIVTIGDFSHLFDIGEEMGQFKIEKDIETGKELRDVDAIIWGTKAKAIGNNIALSGVFKSDLSLEGFREGKVKARRMKGIKALKDDDVGKFFIEERDLNKQMEEFWKSEELLGSLPVYFDKEINDLSYFASYLKNVRVSPV